MAGGRRAPSVHETDEHPPGSKGLALQRGYRVTIRTPNSKVGEKGICKKGYGQ